MEKIGILTGGGDCPGLNAVIRAVVRKSHALGYDVLGIKKGWAGLSRLPRHRPTGCGRCCDGGARIRSAP